MDSLDIMPETSLCEKDLSRERENGHHSGSEEEEEQDLHDTNGWGNGAQQSRVILVGRIDPMEHVEPVYGTDDDDEDEGGADCGSDCSHGRSAEIAAEEANNTSIADAWFDAMIGPPLTPGPPGPWGPMATAPPPWVRPLPPPPTLEPAPGALSLAGLLGRSGNVTRPEDKPYCCPVCRRRFVRYGHYAKHLYFEHEAIASREDTVRRPVAPPVMTVGNGSLATDPKPFIYGDTLIFPGSSPSQLPAPPQLSPAPNLRRSFDCTDCDATFSDRESRARHSAEHEQFQCDVCGRGFRDERERDHHTSMCDACGKRFHLMHSFARHMRTHTGEQPFACDLCGKRFNDSGNMAKHVRTHSGELPYPCTQCPRRFTDRANRAKHVRAAHSWGLSEERPFPCAQCGRAFANGSNLARHIKAAHRQLTC